MINVTEIFLPPLEEYTAHLQGICRRNQPTNNGPLVQELGIPFAVELPQRVARRIARARLGSSRLPRDFATLVKRGLDVPRGLACDGRMRLHELVGPPKLAGARAEALGLLRSSASPTEFPSVETKHVRAIEDPAHQFTDAFDDDARFVDPAYDEPD